VIITEVNIALSGSNKERVVAFCSLVFDNCFVVKDIRLIEVNGVIIVAMPSRKITYHCPKCGLKNHLKSNFCNQCGVEFKERPKFSLKESGEAMLYADVAHPITLGYRNILVKTILDEYDKASKNRAS